MKRKICVISTTRADYGLLRWLLHEIDNDTNFELQLVATGTHLEKEFGYTLSEIEQDGFNVLEKFAISANLQTMSGVSQSMGKCLIQVSEVFERLQPDLLIVLGDRYELLPICSAAVVFKIPIAHISGGDITIGAIDDQVRHAVTKMATFHFPGNIESANRIVQMGEHPKRVFDVGEPGLENYHRLNLLSRNQLIDKFGWPKEMNWILFTYHSETQLSLNENLNTTRNILDALDTYDGFCVIMTKANADHGGIQINNVLANYAEKNPSKFFLHNSLGYHNYISAMKHAYLMVGNSSSGIVEAPIVTLPVINVGKRQLGRYCCENVINSDSDRASIKNAVDTIYSEAFQHKLKNINNYYGDGKTSKKIVKRLRDLNFKVKIGFYEQ